MSARRILSNVMIAVAFRGCMAAEAASPCSPALSEVDVEHGFKVQTDCGLAVRTVRRLPDELNRAAKGAELSGAQRVSLARAANVMLGAVHVPPGGMQHKTEVELANIAPLIESLAVKLKVQPDTDPVAAAHKWNARYKNLLHRSSIKRSSNPLELQIDAALDRFDLDRASTLTSALVSGLLADQQTTTKTITARYYDAAEIELLRFKPQSALPYLHKAYALQPEDTDVATAFADTLQEQGEPARAEPIYRALRLRYQALALEKPATWQPDVARTLVKLGNVYVALRRPKEAETAWLQALEIDWLLARDNPATYGPGVADTLDKLGALYRDTGRLSDAADAYREALDVDRALASRDPATYLPDIATTLNDLAILYSTAQRMSEAEQAYQEALEIQSALVRDNPAAWHPALARTLNNLGNVYSAMQRLGEAEQAYQEALTIRRQLVRESPARYQSDLARTLSNLGVLYRATQRPRQAQQAYEEALRIYRTLARKTPAVDQPDEARTLNNLGVLFSHTQRPREAEDAYRQALDLYRTLSRDDPVTYRQDEARTLGNLGALFSQTQRPRQAEEARREATRLLETTDAP